jgi:hypothetical protein
MATKKKTKKKSNKIARKKPTPMKTAKRPKKLVKKKPATKSVKEKASTKKPARRKSKRLGGAAFSPPSRSSRSGEQSGDLQGLSHREAADSESVDELLEEGNAFEADAVMGVEEAGNADEQEVRTHEVPEDDVPGEYLDED